MAILRFGRGDAPPLLFAHANGFCASAYRQMLAAAGAAFDIYAVDLRGHGRTRLPTDVPNFTGLEVHGADLGALLNTLKAPTRWTLSGHSLGAVAVTLAAKGRCDVAALRLIEPVALPRLWSAVARSPIGPSIMRRTPLAAGARARRGAFKDRDSVRSSYRGKALFSTWADGILDDYLDDGLKAAAGGVALSCAPAWEAANFAAQAHDFWGAVDQAPAPIAVLAADHPSTTTPAGSVRRFRRRGADVEIIAGCTHLVPFEQPLVAARFLKGA